MFKNLRSSRSLSLVSLVFVFALLATPILGQRRQSASGPPSSSGGPDPLKVLQWRSIGPFRGGRVTAVAGVASQPSVFYFGATGGGVWKTNDGGINWEPISDGSVFGTGSVGAIGLSDSDPNTIYVGMGESPIRGNVSHGDGVYKSTDGGKTWKHIGLEDTRQIARIRVHPKNPDIVYVAAQGHVWAPNEQRGVFRSKDAGKTWTKTNEQRNLGQRAWYYSRIYADPKNADTVYVLNTGFYRSNDGGRTFTGIGVPHGDNHDLWIAPEDPNRMIESNDGGANVSFNGGRSWSEQDQPTAQFYRVALDNDFPYHVYGAQQDNSTVRIASRTTDNGITERDWFDVGGGESGWIAPSPKDSQIIFAGSYDGLTTRYDHHTGQLRDVNPYPNNPMGGGAVDSKYRFQWNFPLLFSPNDPNTLYAAANVLFKSTNEGQSWEIISPDLTRNDKSKQASSGGPITKDNTSIEYYDTIFTVMESPVKAGTIWTGADDGVVSLTRDGGKNWSNVTPPSSMMPEWIQINSLDAGAFDAGTAYVAATMYKYDDYKPYLYKTTDYGKSWKKITNGIPDGAFTRVIREDPNKRGLLYAGTETGIYVSFDDGANWQSMQFNLPVVPISDLVIHKREKELVAATQGRAFWIFDDLPELHQIMDAGGFNTASQTKLFKPKDAYRMPGGGGQNLPPTTTLGKNPANGVVIYYSLKAKPTSDVVLEFLDPSGKSIRKFTARAPRPQPSPAPGAAQLTAPPEQQPPATEEEGFFGGAAARVTTDAGLNRFVWDMRYSDATRFPGMILWAGQTQGPKVIPGNYQVKLTVDGQTMTETFEVKADPRLTTTAAACTKQLDLSLKIRDKLTRPQ